MNKLLGILIVGLITLTSLVGCVPAEVEEPRTTEAPISVPAQEPTSAPETAPNVVPEEKVKDIEAIMDRAERLGIKVQAIVHEGSSINISFQADSYTTFRDYLTALEESGRFSTPIPRPPEGFPYVKSGIITLEPRYQYIDMSALYHEANQATAPINASAAIEVLVSIAERSGIDITPESGKFIILAPKSPRQENVGDSNYQVMPFKNISAQGDYDTMMAFISDLDSGGTLKTMVLTSVTIQFEVDGKIETRAIVDVDIYTKSY